MTSLLLLSAVIGFVGTVLFTAALLVLSTRRLAPLLPPMCHVGRWGRAALVVAMVASLTLAATYRFIRLRPV